tara:strand:+ start:180 stop:806 length:627 start_codon:yes stop_codon:yes gene_type:complete
MSYTRNFKYLNHCRVIYRRLPISDTPTEETDQYMYYKDGTYQCYELFRSKAKITTYRSFKWHVLVLWYLNDRWSQTEALDIACYLSYKKNGFISFDMKQEHVDKLVHEISLIDLEEPPKNKLRKIMFKWNCGLTKEQKLSIVGKLIGRTKSVNPSDIYECMLEMHEISNKITISKIAKLLKCSTRTIYRNMDKYPALKEEKELLNTKS